MPTYEYLCAKCGRTFDVFQSMTDEPLKKCPDKTCKGRVKRLVSGGGGVIFKGEGFYATDYKGAKAGKKNGDESKSEKPAPCAAAESGACPSAGSCPAAKGKN
ncbi:zinc ribbon domain-containing protein [Candidatus Sumerlaeota bacterium]|nr:zinc ribbon domain-containing protein [Candidatus Sumerlaeota bacterium]